MYAMEEEEFSMIPPLPPRYRFRDLILGDASHYNDDRVRVEFFTNEKSLKERLQLYFIKNQRSSLRIRIFNLAIKILTCALYVVRVSMDTLPHCQDVAQTNDTSVECWKTTDNDDFRENHTIDWDRILWVRRTYYVWIVQVSVACISLTETCLVQYLSYKGNVLQQITSPMFIMELICTVPFIITIFSEKIRNIFIPVFLNCWLAKQALQNMFSDLHRVMQKSNSAPYQEMVLCATMFCLVFTSVCGIEHLQRGGNQQFTLFESFWFSVVTFSTVGYGDMYPDIWISQLFVICMIIAALIVLPSQFEQLVYAWLQRQKQGGRYSSHRAQTERHVVVCTTALQADTVMDFLNEFYAHPKLQDYYVILFSPCELDSTMKVLLQIPMWAQRVIYMQGSALKDSDLARCRVQDAEACFILANRNFTERNAADQHTILRSWAIKDFAPHCPQYVQIFRPENKFHVKFAEHVVCEDEFKYALLANNCLCPATSTLVCLLLHTSRGQEGQTSSEEWQRLYGKCSGNEIYHIFLSQSKFFQEYEGKSFTYASFHAHRRFGVSLVGIQQSDLKDSTIQLNPGPRHIMKKTDICFYLNITKEENTRTFNLNQSPEESKKSEQTNVTSGTKIASKVGSVIASVGSVALELQQTKTSSNSLDSNGRADPKKLHLDLPKKMNLQNLQQKRPSIAPVPAVMEAYDIKIQVSSDEESDDEIAYADDTEEGNPDYIRGFPPVTPYVGTSPTLCHLMKVKRPLCCLKLVQVCEHCHSNNSKEYGWSNRAIILAADYASNGIYNFIVPLRSHARPKNSLNPIVLMFTREPDKLFLETICHFPMVYWMLGSIDYVDDLLLAGINLADNVVIVNKESSNSVEEETLADCNTIVAVQTIYRLFPSANIITELSQSSNMRFMQFKANDMYSYSLSKLEKKERSRGSHLSYMFRLPFAAGNVFSASMMDTLLYQAYVKEYLITFVRLLLGIDQAVGSGHLSCMKITKDDLWIRTYGRLYQKLCSTSCEIPIGIYRTTHHCSPTARANEGAGVSANSSMVFRDQSALNLAFRNSVIRRKPRSSTSSNTMSYSKPRPSSTQKVSLSMMGVDLEESFSETHMTPERHEISHMVKSRMQSIGHPTGDYAALGGKDSNMISYVIINPNYDLQLQKDDIIYLIRPSSLSPQPSPLIDERKMQELKKRNMDRKDPLGADNSDLGSTAGKSARGNNTTKKHKFRMSPNDTNSKIPIIYTDDSDEEIETNAEHNTGEAPNVPRFHLATDSDTADDTICDDSSLGRGIKGTVV